MEKSRNREKRMFVISDRGISGTAMSLEEARKASGAEAEKLYIQIIEKDTGINEAAIQTKETAFLELGAQYRDQKQGDKLRSLLALARKTTGGYAKSKAAKIIRMLVDYQSKIPGILDVKIETINECVQWAIAENRAFLRQNLQVRLVSLLLSSQKYQEAIDLIGALLKELKRLDDKMMLVEVQLLEAKVFHALRNLAKSRASLTSARTSANSIYTPTLMQAELDTMAGILQAEDGDYKTAFSYFYEAFEGYSSIDDPQAVTELKYLLLVKIMLNLTDDVEQLLHNKTVQKYSGRDIDAMTAMARAHKERSLQEFEKVMKEFGTELSADPFIRSHFTALYDKLLQDNLVKEIQPYSCVEITYLAERLHLDTKQVEGKLSQMILDKVFYGVLDQGNGWLLVYPEPVADETYELSVETIKRMSTVVDMLFDKAAAIN